MTELLDFRNQNLWNEIEKEHVISFEDSDSENYGCFTKGSIVIFYINRKNLCQSSFTHEMLHVKIKMNDLNIGSMIEATFNQSNVLKTIMTPRLFEHIGNCLEHVKMLPIYLHLGYEREKFLYDYDEDKCTDEDLQLLKTNYRIAKKINVNAVDQYIGRLIAVLADPNNKIGYFKKDLQELKKLDPLLYQIIERLVNHWKEIKIENRNNLDDDDIIVSGNFYDNMKKWLSINSIKIS